MAPRILLPLLVCLLLAGCGGDTEREAPSGGSAPSTDLTVSVDADGDGPGAAKTLQVRCDQPGGDAACPAAKALSARALEPVSTKRVCTDIFGGPQTAEISGTLKGDAVKARYTRSNGCEIERWKAAAPLLDRVR
jgi:uncharacterized protein YceK